MICEICPRRCKVDREKQRGFCGEKGIRISKIIENFEWEEPCISGGKGTLAIFFSGCNLRCNFCQNYEISHIGKGEEFTPEQFRALLERYDLERFDSIDLITPSHFATDLCKALDGFSSPVPIVFNSNGYECEAAIRAVAKFVDVFLVDLKFFDSDLSLRLAGARDYFDVASNAIKLMAQLKPNVFKGGIMQSGVLIRHLILPGHVKDSIKLLDFVKSEIPNPQISIMSQFTPTGRGELDRPLTPLEVKTVLSHAEKIGLNEGYTQDLASSNACFIPKF